MRLFILGANGKTGTQLIDLALDRGHEITAFVRSPGKITRRHPLLEVLPGDPRSVDELASALPGHDVVLSGQPALVLYRDDRPFAAVLLDVGDHKIQRIFFHADPTRLGHVGHRRRH